MNFDELNNMTAKEIITIYPYLKKHLENHPQDIKLKDIADIDETFVNNIINYIDYVEKNDTMANKTVDNNLSLTIIAGQKKDGSAENFDSIEITKGDIIAIVGPTGSGKSRLLEDIEWGANNDTPTNRKILYNGKEMTFNEKYYGEKIIAQLSQNMNFVMDLTIEEYLTLRCESHNILNDEKYILEVFNCANELAGEKFTLSTNLTDLSGGQSRSLMIADTAILSKAKIVLIDEIENAGVNRENALNLLLNNDKIILMATHDPMLALLANKRIVINNGGIEKIIDKNESETMLLKEIEEINERLTTIQDKLRKGEMLI